MGKSDHLQTLARMIALAVAHKIGYLIQSDSDYAKKYQKEYMNFMRQAESINFLEHWNDFDKEQILQISRKKVTDELSARTYLKAEKFTIIEKELFNVMHDLGLL